jgi:hypothetical protein
MSPTDAKGALIMSEVEEPCIKTGARCSWTWLPTGVGHDVDKFCCRCGRTRNWMKLEYYADAGYADITRDPTAAP